MHEFLREFGRRAGIAFGVLLIFFGGVSVAVAFKVTPVHPADLCQEDEAYAPIDPGYPTPGYVVRECVNWSYHPAYWEPTPYEERGAGK